MLKINKLVIKTANLFNSKNNNKTTYINKTKMKSKEQKT